VSGRAVEVVFCFDRHAATDLSVAYAILVPARRARTGRAGPSPHRLRRARQGDLFGSERVQQHACDRVIDGGGGD
jgi:hypothetical protein